MKLNLSKSLVISVLVSAVGLSGCVDNDKNLFDAEKIKELYESTFPVKDIDPGMDWKTTQEINVDISVNEDFGTDYKIQIFDNNPLDPTSNAKLLAEGLANQEIDFITTIDCAKALDMVFVARIDKKGRYLVKPTSIKNAIISASFGKAKTDVVSRAMTREGSSSLIPTYNAPYADNELAQLINEATELSSKVSNNTISLGEGGIFKVTKDIECRTFNYGWNKCTLIITSGAEFKINNNFDGSGRFNIIIADGKLNIEPNNVTISNAGNLTIMPQGELIGKRISFSDNSDGFLNYNAGMIELDGLTLSGSSEGTFYNCGEMNIKHDLIGSNAKLTLINRGELDVEGNLNFGSIARLLSACSTEIKLKLECKDLIIGKNSKVKCGEFTTGGADNLTITMEPASMLECEGQATLNRIITGPNATEDYALIKIKSIKENQDYGNNHSKANGNIYFALKEHRAVGQWDNGGYSGFIHMLERSDMSGYLCNDKTAPFIMDEDECTGNGYVPDEEGDEIVIDPINYSYAFEDNYPLAGDYDFNDIVLNVITRYIKENKTNAIKEIQYDVILKAVGATKKLGAGLRLVNIPKSVIEQISFAGSTTMRETLVNSMFETGTTENNANEVIIPLFGDAHQVYDFNGIERPLLNTGQQQTSHIDTLKVIIIPNDKKQTTPIITKDNLDFFIAYPIGNQGKRTEVHLYEFRRYGATANGNVHEENLEVAGNRTWGICVPNFKYPTESTKITEAYPNFEAWAQNHTSNLDWYNHPTDKTDKKYIFE